MNKIDKRFANRIGVEYNLFPLAAPHYNELQFKLAELIIKYKVKNPIILEIGCGTGLTTTELHKARPDAKIVAIDAEEIMVKQAKSFLADNKIEIVWIDALEYLKKLESQSLDIVVSAFCLHNTPLKYRREVFEEISRVLKPNGLCINGDKIALDNEEAHKKTLEKQIEAFAVFKNTEYPELQEEWTKHYLEDDKTKLTEKEQMELLKLAGCQDIKMKQRWLMDAIYVGIKK